MDRWICRTPDLSQTNWFREHYWWMGGNKLRLKTMASFVIHGSRALDQELFPAVHFVSTGADCVVSRRVASCPMIDYIDLIRRSSSPIWVILTVDQHELNRDVKSTSPILFYLIGV